MRATSRNDRPPNDYRRQFTISKHAVDRFRERVDEEFRCRDDYDLSNLLDEKIRHAEHCYSVDDPRAPGEMTLLYEIQMRKTGTFHVVVRNETAITVLDPEMAKRNFATAWKPTMNKPFTADKLKNVIVTQPSPLSQRDKAILRGDIQPTTQEIALPTVVGAAPSYSPLELAGFAHARALRRQSECTRAVARARKALVDAEAALEQATAECATAHQTMMDLVGADEEASC